MCWDEVGERRLVGPELVHITSEKVKVVRDKLKIARDSRRVMRTTVVETCNLR